MRVLDVEGRVLVVLPARDVQVEIQVGVGRAHEEEEPGAVGPDVLDQVAQRHEPPAPLAHLDLLALPVRARLPEVHLLDDQHLEEPALEPQRRERRLHRGDVGVMVGAPEVDRDPVAAGPLVAVVGEVGKQVGGRAVAAHDDPVLVVAEVPGAQVGRLLELRRGLAGPALRRRAGGAVHLGAPGAVGHAARLERAQRLGHRPRAVQLGLPEPARELRAVLVQVPALLAHHLLERLVAEPRGAAVRRAPAPRAPAPRAARPRSPARTRPRSRPPGTRARLPRLSREPRRHGLAQQVDLAAGVVDVELPRGVAARSPSAAAPGSRPPRPPARSRR